jgi:hypothetical protein
MSNGEGVLKLKFINLKTQIYPDPLVETDYFRLKVGDLVSLGHSSSNIYRIETIHRDLMTDFKRNHWRTKLKGYNGQSSDKLASSLIDEYEKNGNFGLCVLKLRKMIGSGKLLKRQICKTVLELDYVRGITWSSCLNKVHIPNIINEKDYLIKRIERKAQELLDKKPNVENQIKALRDLMDILNPKPVIPVIEAKDMEEEIASILDFNVIMEECTKRYPETLKKLEDQVTAADGLSYL